MCSIPRDGTKKQPERLAGAQSHMLADFSRLRTILARVSDGQCRGTRFSPCAGSPLPTFSPRVDKPEAAVS